MLYLLEGIDGCGKETQSIMLAKHLGVEKVSFPRYGTPAASVLESYLHGELKFDAYAASSAFALDRVAWANEWREAGSPTVVLDRYIFSNFAYQGTRIFEKNGQEEALRFINWAKDYEYNRLNLPKPDVMIYLTWEKSAWRKLLRERDSAKHSGKDIHESNLDYLDAVYDFGLALAKQEGAKIVGCDGKSRAEVHEAILSALRL